MTPSFGPTGGTRTDCLLSGFACSHGSFDCFIGFGGLARIPDFPRVVGPSFVIPGFFDEACLVVSWAPAQEEFGFGVVEPGAVEWRLNPDAGQAARFVKVVGHVLIIDGFVHTNVEQLLVCFGVIEGAHDRFDEIVDVYEIALNGAATCINHNRNGV